MLIGGWQRFSLIDFPGKIAAVLFTQGCPFRCIFCHNEILVEPKKFQDVIPNEDIFSFLKSRKNQLQGVVISGGEPTLHDDLDDFILKIKDMGFAIKLDTNGLFPKKLKPLIDKKLVDYIAMDIKAPLEKYEAIIGVKIDIENIKESISLIINSNLNHEFRTTVLPSFHSKEDVINMAKLIKGSQLYVLQKFIAKNALVKNLDDSPALWMQNIKSEVQKYVNCIQR